MDRLVGAGRNCGRRRRCVDVQKCYVRHVAPPLHRAVAEAGYHGANGLALCEFFPSRDGHERRLEGGSERAVLATRKAT